MLLDAEMVSMIVPAAQTMEVNGPKAVVYWGNVNIAVIETCGAVAQLCGIDMKSVRIVKPDAPKPEGESVPSKDRPLRLVQ